MHRIASILFLSLAATLPAAGQEPSSKGGAAPSTQAQKDPAIDESLSGGQYINRAAKFSLTLPSDWIIDTEMPHGPTTLSWFSSLDKVSRLGVTRDQDPRPLQSYKEALELNFQRRLFGYEKLSESSVTIDGQAALLISYRIIISKSNKTPFEHLMAIIPSGNTYTKVMASCAAPRFHDRQPIFERILTPYHSTGPPSATASSQSIASPLTAKRIESLRATANDPAGDYFIGSPDEQKNIVSAFVEDNSKSDPTFLYLAANTAYRTGEIKEAAFLFYAAQIRKRFDYKRYGLGDANGNNIQTYWGFLNQTIGESVNPAITRRPQEFSEVVDMLAKWQVVPADDALYVHTMYGAYALPKNQWQAAADSIKKDFMDNYGFKLKKFLSNPENAQAFIFFQDYNLGHIPHTPENDQKYEKYRDTVNKGLNQ